MNRKFIITTLLAAFAVMVSSNNVHAQRTIAGKGYISVSGQYAITRERGKGVMLEGGQYLLSSRWQCGVNFMSKSGDEYDYNQLVVTGEWMYRFVSTRDRALNFYIGPGIHLGYEYMQGDSPVEVISNTATGTITTSMDEIEDGSTDKFLYGLHARLDTEIFVSKHVAFVIGLRAPLTFNTNFTKTGMSVTAGLCFNF